MNILNRLFVKLFGTPREREINRKGLKECSFSYTEDSMCPCWREITPRGGFKMHNLGSCCRIRMDRAKMAYMVVHDTMHGASSTQELKEQSRQSLENYKQNFPEEYHYVFGDDSIGYSVNIK